MNREDELIGLLNRMIQILKPFKYEDFNRILPEWEKGSLKKVEDKDDHLVICPVSYSNEEREWAVSTASLLATVTDTLIDKRLSLIVDDDGFVTGFQWYQEDEKS